MESFTNGLIRLFGQYSTQTSKMMQASVRQYMSHV